MDELLRQVLGIYLAEVREQAQRISAALLSMERDPATIPTAMEELYREAHSLKGWVQAQKCVLVGGGCSMP